MTMKKNAYAWLQNIHISHTHTFKYQLIYWIALCTLLKFLYNAINIWVLPCLLVCLERILGVYFNENIRNFKKKWNHFWTHEKVEDIYFNLFTENPVYFIWYAYFIFLCVTVGLHAFLGIMCKPVLAEFGRGHQISWTWDIDSCHAPYCFWECNLDLFKEQQLFLTIELSLYPLPMISRKK